MPSGIMITQQELAQIVELERQKKSLEEQLEDRRMRLLPLVLEGFPVEPGRFEARAIKHIGRAGFSYKRLVVSELGEEAAAAYKKQFPTHVYFELEIVEHAVPPLWRGLFGESGARE